MRFVRSRIGFGRGGGRCESGQLAFSSCFRASLAEGETQIAELRDASHAQKDRLVGCVDLIDGQAIDVNEIVRSRPQAFECNQSFAGDDRKRLVAPTNDLPALPGTETLGG